VALGPISSYALGRRSSDKAAIHPEGKCPPPEGGLLSYVMPSGWRSADAVALPSRL